MFSTPKNLEFLQSFDVWLADATFKVAPTLFQQLFIIHGFRNGVAYPLLYCLMPYRTSEMYRKVLTALKNLHPGLAPTTIMTDYEMAEINAFKHIFPNAEHKGCFFHFCQCFYRHIQQSLEILNLYSSDSEFSLKIWYLVALAFVPIQDVMATFEQLMEDDFFVENEGPLLQFVTYFERTWIGPWNRRKTARIPPLFAIDLWNCYNSVLENLPKTNNSCEGFHNGFSAMLGSSHPTIYKLIDALKEQQVLTELAINQLRAGIPPPPPRKKYKRSSENLKKIVETYGSPGFVPLDYLRQIAYCIRAD